MNNRPFEEWARRMMVPMGDSFKCQKCHQEFSNSVELASHLQRHKKLSKEPKLSELDRRFLQSIRIKPWDTEDPPQLKG